MANYTLASIFLGNRGKVVADLMEDDVIIGQVRRKAATYGIMDNFTVKFGSDRAACRFDTFCNCLSRSETIEILLSNELAKELATK